MNINKISFLIDKEDNRLSLLEPLLWDQVVKPF